MELELHSVDTLVKLITPKNGVTLFRLLPPSTQFVQLEKITIFPLTTKPTAAIATRSNCCAPMYGSRKVGGGATVVTKTSLCERAAATTILLTFLVCSAQAYGAEQNKLVSAGPTAGKYISVNHAPEPVEPTKPALNIAGSIPAIDSAAAHVAGGIYSQFMERYVTLGRHSKALAFELLLIGCYVALRIGVKRDRRNQQSEPLDEPTNANSLIGSSK